MAIDNLCIIRGKVTKRGSLTTTSEFFSDGEQNIRGLAVGKESLDLFAANTSTKSTTTETKIYEISLLQISGISMTDINIDTPAFFDAISEGDLVGCVFSDDKTCLYYLFNKTNGMEVPSNKSLPWIHRQNCISFFDMLLLRNTPAKNKKLELAELNWAKTIADARKI